MTATSAARRGRPRAEPARHRRRGRRRRCKDTKLAQVLYHDWEAETYDDKWSISLRRALHRLRARPVRRRRRRAAPALRAGTRTGLRHRLLPAQPDAGWGGEDAVRSPTCRRAWSRWRCATPSTSVSTSTAASPTPRRFRTRTTPSTWSSGTPCCTTFPTSSSRCARFCGCSSRVAGSSSPVSRRTVGNFYARWLGRVTWEATTTVTKLPVLSDWRRPQAELDESSRAAALEAVVDMHTFDPVRPREDRRGRPAR